MQAIILAAGLGRRLGKYTNDNTKCMLPVNGVKLIDRMVLQLYSAGITKIIMVLGYKAENVKNYINQSEYSKKIEFIFIDNPVYDQTNNVYSLFLASEYLVQEDTLLLESDLIFEDGVLKNLVECPYSAALVDKYDSWMDGTVVKINEDNYISDFISKSQFEQILSGFAANKAVNKAVNEATVYYKTVNIYRLNKDFSKDKFLPFLKVYMDVYGKNNYYEGAFGILTYLDKNALKIYPMNGAKWYEIDDKDDLDRAEELFK